MSQEELFLKTKFPNGMKNLEIASAISGLRKWLCQAVLRKDRSKNVEKCEEWQTAEHSQDWQPEWTPRGWQYWAHRSVCFSVLPSRPLVFGVQKLSALQKLQSSMFPELMNFFKYIECHWIFKEIDRCLLILSRMWLNSPRRACKISSSKANTGMH